jgi:hypothetical protein
MVINQLKTDEKMLHMSITWEIIAQIIANELSMVAWYLYGSFQEKLSLAPINYRALAICPHELPSVIPDLIKLPNLANNPFSSIFALHFTFEGILGIEILFCRMDGKNGKKEVVG